MKRGFTLIELLVVVSIISLLSSVVLSSLQDARRNAEVIKIVQDLRSIEQAFNLLRNDLNSWPYEDEVTSVGGENPDISEIIADTSTTNFYQYLPEAPVPSYAGVIGVYEYNANDDNADASEHDPSLCSSDSDEWNDGVTLLVTFTGQNAEAGLLFQELSKIIDRDIGDDPIHKQCGIIRYNNNHSVLYSLSNTH
jgi:prepilin-type N-terminal cleavage/methylation domain-containing protein